MKDYINFKLAQFARINGIDMKAADAKQQLAEALNANMRDWVAEAIAAGH